MRGPRGALVVLLIACAWHAGGARAEDRPLVRYVIERGNESRVQDLVRPYVLQGPVGPTAVLAGIQIRGGRVIYRLATHVGLEVQVELRHPKSHTEAQAPRPPGEEIQVVTDTRVDIYLVEVRAPDSLTARDARDLGGLIIERLRAHKDELPLLWRAPDWAETAPGESESDGLAWVGLVLALLIVTGGLAWALALAARFVSRPRGALLLRRVALAVCTMGFSLALAELALRALALAPPTVPSADSTSTGACFGPMNDLNIRAPWTVVPERAPGEVRIAVLGDSFAYGEGVEWWETLPMMLEAVLIDRYPRHDFKVINLGESGDDTQRELERYVALHPIIQPDLLVLLAYLNDFSSHSPAETLLAIYETELPFGALRDRSYLLGHIAARHRLRGMQRSILDDYWGRVLADLPHDFGRFARPLIDLRDFAGREGVRFELALFPWLVGLEGGYPLQPVHDKVARFARAMGIPFLDLLPVFLGRRGDDLRITPSNEHPNAEAHFLAARALADFLEPTLDDILNGR